MPIIVHPPSCLVDCCLVSEDHVEGQPVIHEILGAEEWKLDGPTQLDMLIEFEPGAEGQSQVVMPRDVVGAKIGQVGAFEVEWLRSTALRVMGPVEFHE